MHPLIVFRDDSHLLEKVAVTYRGETLNGIPHGLGYLDYTNKEEEDESFQGCAVMTRGEISGGPALFINGTGTRYSFSHMHQGRPDGSGKSYLAEGMSCPVTDPKVEVDASGFAFYVGNYIDGQFDGLGKHFFDDGGIFEG